MSPQKLTPRERTFYTISWFDVNGEQHDKWFISCSGSALFYEGLLETSQNHDIEFKCVEYQDDGNVEVTMLHHHS